MTSEHEVEVDKDPAAPSGALPEPSDTPGGVTSGSEPEPSTEPDPNEDIRAFMAEYRAEREAKAKAEAEAEAAKKKVPAPKAKAKPAPKVEPEPKAEAEPERSYGSARWFNRKSKKHDG